MTGRGGGCYQLVWPGLTALPLSPTTPFPPPLVPTDQPSSTQFSPLLFAVLLVVVPPPPFVSLYAQLLQHLAQRRFWLHRRTANLPGLHREGKSRPPWQIVHWPEQLGLNDLCLHILLFPQTTNQPPESHQSMWWQDRCFLTKVAVGKMVMVVARGWW